MATEFSKSDLIAAISEQTGHDTETVSEVFQSFLNLTAQKVASEGRVEYKDFGTFNLESRQARQGTFAPTGKAWKSPARLVLTFKAGKQFLKIANENNTTEFEITNKK
jgi:DNA-binding protein HU-beta